MGRSNPMKGNKMHRANIPMAFVASLFLTTFSFAITGEQVVNQVDRNMTFNTAYFESTMVIHIGKEVREKKMTSYARGRTASFAEFLSPARDRGVKYLKLEDNMWMYLPSVDKTIKIAGHMLRQSMMGSDFSYEDALESEKLLEKYTATLISEEPVKLTFKKGNVSVSRERKCYVVDLTAKVKNVAYFKRRVWIDKELFVPVREDLFAMSGKKLKEMTVGDVEQFGTRYYPMYYSMKNLLRADSLTEMYITKARFNVDIPTKLFSVGSLTK